jgi:tetratricopeptide (TPR) repeat protein
MSLVIVLSATGLQQKSAEPLTLHDPPRYKKGEIEIAIDGGAHSSAGMSAQTSTPPPASPGSSELEAKLRQDVAAQPENAVANLALGGFLLETQRAGEALHFLQTAVRREPGSVQARHDLAVALLEEGRLAEAEALLKALQGESPQAAVSHLEARWLAASRRPVEAAEKFQQAAEGAPTETHLFDWGNHMLAHGAAEPAGKIFEYAAAKYPRSARLKIALGVSYYARGDYDRAVTAVCEGTRLSPDDLRPLVFLGQMIGIAPQHEREIQRELERFARLYPQHAQAQYYYGLSLLALADQKTAERQFRKAAEINPNMPQVRLELGKLLADKGQNEEAIRELEAAVRLAPDVSGSHYKLAQLYQRTGRKDLAERHFAAYRKVRADENAREEQERRRRAALTVNK